MKQPPKKYTTITDSFKDKHLCTNVVLNTTNTASVTDKLYKFSNRKRNTLHTQSQPKTYTTNGYY